MIGQQSILKVIDQFNIDNFPKSTILIGDNGCGKHTLINYISKKLNLPLINIDHVDSEVTSDVIISPLTYIYVIDGDNLTLKQQNILLKIIEEPLNNAFIIITSEYKYNLIETVLNRCYKIQFNDYTQEELLEFIPEKYKNNIDVTKICNTPGKLKKLDNIDFDSLYNFCIKFINKLECASLANTLTIVDKINYNDKYDKFDLNIFLDTILYLSFKYYIETNNKNCLFIYQITLNYYYKFKNKIYNKEQLMSNYLINVWQKVKNIED